jgi:hypothetical protein
VILVPLQTPLEGAVAIAVSSGAEKKKGGHTCRCATAS